MLNGLADYRVYGIDVYWRLLAYLGALDNS